MIFAMPSDEALRRCCVLTLLLSLLSACGGGSDRSASNENEFAQRSAGPALASAASGNHGLKEPSSTASVATRTGADMAGPDADISVIVRQPFVSEADGRILDRAWFATAGRIPAATQRAGDADAGRRALLEGSYISCGLPERVLRELLGSETPMEVPGRDDSANGLPYNMNVVETSDGQRAVSVNCLGCHGTPLFGELVLGLGNEFLDFTGDASAQVERAGLLVRGEQEIAMWERYADRIAAIAPYMRPHTVGVNPANNLTFALIAHRHAHDNAWSDEPLLPLPPTDPPPVSVPPWWRMQKKTAMFNMGELRGDHARVMMTASALCSDSIEELERIDEFAPDIRAFIASLAAPSWPFDIDTELARRGEPLFEQTCSACHGHYGDEPSWPARLIPLEVIGTDPRLVEFAYGPGAVYTDWFNRSWYGQRSTAAPGPGYVAPPLDGIWATAPFLHNGSVPSLRGVLDSESRPEQWRHTVRDAQDPGGYDTQDMGWRFEIPQEGKSGSAEPARIYDTRLPGYANTGHRFGDHLDNDERSAILEYLKTL